MQKYVVRGNAGFCGTDFCELIEAKNVEEAWEMGNDVTRNWLDSYGVELVDYESTQEDIDYFEDNSIPYTYEMDFYVELYNPEQHDCLM